MEDGVGVAEPEAGGVRSEGWLGPATPRPALTGCSDGAVRRNMASMEGIMAWPKGVLRNSAGSPAGRRQQWVKRLNNPCPQRWLGLFRIDDLLDRGGLGLPTSEISPV
jgi:hypothetical protein